MSAAVATRPPVAAPFRPAAPARAPAPPQGRGVAATLVEKLATTAEMAGLSGLHILQVHCTLCHGAIDPGDVIEVDFDVRSVRYDAMYLIGTAIDGQTHWHGARRFQFRGADLWGQEATAGGEWTLLTPDMLARITIYGVVRDVYKTRCRWEAAR